MNTVSSPQTAEPPRHPSNMPSGLSHIPSLTPNNPPVNLSHSIPPVNVDAPPLKPDEFRDSALDSASTPWTRSMHSNSPTNTNVPAPPLVDYTSQPISANTRPFCERWGPPTANQNALPEPSVVDFHSISHRLAPTRHKPLLNREKSLHLPPIAMNVPAMQWAHSQPASERTPMLAPHTPLSPQTQYRPAKNTVSAPHHLTSLGSSHVSPAPSPQTVKQEPEFLNTKPATKANPNFVEIKTEPAVESLPEPKTQAESTTQTEAKTQTEPKTQAEPKTQTEPKNIAESITDAISPTSAAKEPSQPNNLPPNSAKPIAPINEPTAHAPPASSAISQPAQLNLDPSISPYPLSNHAYMAALANAFPASYPSTAYPPGAYAPPGYYPSNFTPGFPQSFPMSPIYPGINPTWFGQGYPLFNPVSGLPVTTPTGPGPLNVTSPQVPGIPQLYANGVPMYMYPSAPLSINPLSNAPVTPTQILEPGTPLTPANSSEPSSQRDQKPSAPSLPSSYPSSSNLSPNHQSPNLGLANHLPAQAPTSAIANSGQANHLSPTALPAYANPSEPVGDSELKLVPRHPKKVSLPVIDSLSPVITTAEEFAQKMTKPKPPATRGPRSRDEAVRMFQEYRRRKGYAAGDAALPPSDEFDKPKLTGDENGGGENESESTSPATGSDTRKVVRELWPPGMLPPPGVMPAGEMPPPPPSFTNPTRVLSARELKENEENALHDKHDREAYRRRRDSYIPYSAVKSPKLPRSKRYWLDQQAALVANLESRGFVAIYKETEEYSRFFCSLCNKDFETKLLCIRHAVEHLNFKPFRCTDCDMEFTRCDTLQRHLKGRCLGPESQVVLQREAAILERAAGRETEFVLQRVGAKRRARVDKTLAVPESDDDTEEANEMSASSDPTRDGPSASVHSSEPHPPSEGEAVTRTPQNVVVASPSSEVITATKPKVLSAPESEGLKRLADHDDASQSKRRNRVMEDTESSSDEEDASSSRLLTGSKFLRPGPAPVVMPARRK